MFVRAASRRVSGLTSRLTGRGLVVAAARFSGANGDDHVRRDPQVEFFGGDESEAPFAAASISPEPAQPESDGLSSDSAAGSDR